MGGMNFGGYGGGSPSPNPYSGGFSLSQGGGGGWNPMAGGGGFNPYGGGGMSMGYPGQQQGGGGGGWAGNLLSTIGGGMMGTNPLGLGIMAGGQLLSGLLGGFMAGGKQKKKEKAYKSAQSDYQNQAARLFPEMSKESFQYQNPTMNNAINAALAYRMGNMFGNWGMPSDMRQGQGSMNDFFAAMMPQQANTQPTQPFMPGPMPGGPGGGFGGGGPMPGGGMRGRGRGGGGGWMNDIPPMG